MAVEQSSLEIPSGLSRTHANAAWPGRCSLAMLFLWALLCVLLDSFASRLETVVGVASDEPIAMQTSLDERLQKLSPTDFSLAQFCTDFEQRSFSVGQQADGYQHGTIGDAPPWRPGFMAMVANETDPVIDSSIVCFAVKFSGLFNRHHHECLRTTSAFVFFC